MFLLWVKLQMALPVESILKPSPVLKQWIAIASQNIVQSQFNAIAKSMWAVVMVFSSSLLHCKEASDDGMSKLHSPGWCVTDEDQSIFIENLTIWTVLNTISGDQSFFLQISGWFGSRHSWAKSETKLCSTVTLFLQREVWTNMYVCRHLSM